MDSNIFYNLLNYFNKLFKFLSQYTTDKSNPFYNVFILINKVLIWNNNNDKSLTLYFIKLLIIIIILISPFIITIYITIIFIDYVNKIKKYNWKNSENNIYNYDNTNYNYIKNLIYINSYLIFSQKLFILFILSISYIITYLIITNFYNSIFKQINNFTKFINYNISIFIIILSIISLYIVLNFFKYNNVYKYNSNINNLYLEYLDIDFIKKVCNNFVDDNGFNNICYFNKDIINNDTIKNYLNNLNLTNYNNKNLIKKYISAIITFKWCQSIMNNKNSYCNSFNFDIYTYNNMYNVFYCFNEIDSFPFDNNIDDILSQSVLDNIDLYNEIYNIYNKFNNDIATYISNIKKTNINEYSIITLIFIIFIIYFIGLFYIYSYN
jgi:hypothetical protein|tara:strand:- start:480 stop:1622 length:1143 start_codon:yes stop_codon:yes gene_type:complete